MTQTDEHKALSDAGRAKSFTLLDRRKFLTTTGTLFLTAFFPVRSARAESIVAPALAFDGTALIVAGDRVRKVDISTGDHVDLPDPARAIRTLASHPEREGRLLAAPDGGGVVRSQDGGRTWYTADTGLPRAQVSALAIAAGAPDTVYAAVAGDGLWRSEDAGGTWSFVMDRPWIGGAERDVLTLVSVNLASGMGGIWIYAGTEAGLTRVPDCFCRWQDVEAGDAMDALVAGTVPAPDAPLPESEPLLALVSAYAAPERLHAALPSGVWTSTDGGVTWTHQSDRRATALAVSPKDPNHIVATTEDGVIQSRDGGTTWRALATV